MAFKIWSQSDNDRINEIRANRTITGNNQKIVSAIFAVLCLIGAFYTTGPIDKNVPIVFYIFRVIFGENTCIGFVIMASIFTLISIISGATADLYGRDK